MARVTAVLVSTAAVATAMRHLQPSIFPAGAFAAVVPTMSVSASSTRRAASAASRLIVLPPRSAAAGSSSTLDDEAARVAAAREAFASRSARSLGAVGVRVPELPAIRRAVLTEGAKLALDPSPDGVARREACRTPAGKRVAPGWSGRAGRGVEDHPIQSGFYANLAEEEEDRVDEVFGRNVWPTAVDDGGKHNALRAAVRDAGRIMTDAALDVLDLAGKAAAAEAAERGGPPGGDGEGVGGGLLLPDLCAQARSSPFRPARLAYYDANFSREDKILGGRYWLPWHVDFNLATAFIPALWLNESEAVRGGGVAEEGVEASFVGEDPEVIGGCIGGSDRPEADSGLLLRNAAGDMVPAALPEDVVLVQLGAYAQIATGGLLRAGPHAVGRPRSAGSSDEEARNELGRLSFGVFVYAPWDAEMRPPDGCAFSDEEVLGDDFGGLMKKAYTGKTTLAGFQSFANYMNDYSTS